MIGFCPLASGSKGNCIYFGTEKTKILIDAGLSYKMLCLRLQEIQVDIQDIDAIFITHEHTDHIRGLEVIAAKFGIPVFANSDTAKAIYANVQVCPKFKIFATGEPFEYGDFLVKSFSIQHDAADPVAFKIEYKNLKIGFCTDLGFVSPLVSSQLQGCDYLYVEANHQPSMVHASARPAIYKQRVLGRLGHLSNEECAQLLFDVFHSGLQHVHLAHLSSECNNPDLALQIVRAKLQEKGYAGEVSIAHQDKLGKAVLF